MKHSDEDFHKAFEEMVKEAYADLFDLHHDSAWTLPADKLIAFFRGKDKTSDLVGRLQATTFQLLAGFAGYDTVPAVKAPSTPKASSKEKKEKAPKAKLEKSNTPPPAQAGDGVARDVGLTVRIEVNLPPAGDQETYDRIFRSIRENLLK